MNTSNDKKYYVRSRITSVFLAERAIGVYNSCETLSSFLN